MSNNRMKSTYTYAPKISTDNPDSDMAKRLEALLKSKSPVANENPDIHTVVDSEFIVKSPTITFEHHPSSKSSTTSIHEKLNQTTHSKLNSQSPDVVIYSPQVICTPDNVEEGLKKFEEIHKNRPQPGSGKNVVVSHSFTQTGRTLTLADLMREMNITNQETAKTNESSDAIPDDATEYKTGFSIAK